MQSFLSGEEATNLISLVLVVITGGYVFLTWRIARSNGQMIKTMASQFKETIRPYITVSIAVREGVVFVLEIRNSGRSPAKDLTLKIDRDFYPFATLSEERNIKNQTAFTSPISTFSPRETLTFDLSQGFNMDTEKEGKNLTPSEFLINASYEFSGTFYTEQFHISTKHYMGVHAPKSTEEHLAKIEEHLRKLLNKA